jgi:protocatechuate 3,4-dioxygenase beta subunit
MIYGLIIAATLISTVYAPQTDLLCRGADVTTTEPAFPDPSPKDNSARQMTIFGIVHGANDDPVSDAYITVENTDGSDSTDAISASFAATNEGGGFLLGRTLAPGVYKVKFGGSPIASPIDVPETGRRYEVVLLADDAGGNHGPVPTTKPTVGTVIFGFAPRVENIGRDASISISVTSAESHVPLHGENALADHAGAFMLRKPLPLGKYLISASLVSTLSSDEGGTIARAPLVVTPTSGQYLVVELAAPPGVISGRVLDAAGKPVAGASVSLINESEDLTRSTTANDQGRYSLDHIVPEQYIVSASSPLKKTANRQDERKEMKQQAVWIGVMVIGKQPQTKDFTLHQSDDFTAGDDRLVRPGRGAVVQLGAAPSELSGRVVDATGQPAAQATVELLNTSKKLCYLAVTDPHGDYVIHHMVPEQYIVAVSNAFDEALPPKGAAARAQHILKVLVVGATPQTEDFSLVPLSATTLP